MAEELRSVLGFDASQAITTIAKLTTELNAYSAALTKAAGANETFNKSAKGIESNLQAVTSGTTVLDQANKKVKQSLASVSRESVKTGKSINQLAADTKKSSSQMILSWDSVIRIFAIQVIHQAISKVVSSLGEATESARNYEKALAEVQTISGGVYNDLDILAAQVEAVSTATGQPLPIVTEALYQTLSNQVTDAAHAFDFLTTAADFSIAAVTDLNSAVNLLSSVLNSYNMDVSNAAEVSGKLFKMIELGRIRGQEIADTFGRVAQLAAQLGVSIDDLFASMAALTRGGIQYNEAYTLINNVTLKLIKPTQDLKKRFTELGVATAEAGIQAYGYQGFLLKIAEGAGETASELADLYGRVRAIRGALGLSADYADTYVDSLEKIKKAGAETVTKAKALIFETNAKQVELELNKVNIELTKFGRNATEVTLEVFNAFGGAKNTIATVIEALGAGALTWLVWKSNAVTATGAIISRLQAVGIKTVLVHDIWKKLASSPLAWATAVTAAVVIVKYALNKTLNDIKKFRNDTEATLSAQARIHLINYEAELSDQKKNTNKLLAEVQKFFIARQQLYEQAVPKIRYVEQVLFDSLEDQLTTYTSNITGLFDAFKDKASEAVNQLKSIKDESIQISGDISDWNFERSLKNLDAIHQVYAQIERSQSLRNKATELARKGEFDLAKSVNDRAESQAQAALSTADQTGNLALVRKAEDEVERTLKNRLSTQEKIKQNIIDQHNAIQKNTVSMNQMTAALNPLVQTFKDLNKELQKTTDPIDRERILKKMKSIAGDIQTIFSDIKIYANLANITELRKEFNEATSGFFDPLTGQLTTFEESVKRSGEHMKQVFKDIQDYTEQQKIGIRLGKQFDEGTQALLRQKGAQEELNKLVQLLPKDYAVITGELQKITSYFFGSTQAQDKSRGIVGEISAKLRDAVIKAQNLAIQGKSNTKEYGDTLATILRIKEALSKKETGLFGIADITPTTEALDSLFNRLGDIREQQKIISQEAEQSDFIGAFQNKVQTTADAINLINKAARNSGVGLRDNITQGMNAGVTAVQSGADQQIQALKRIEQQAKLTGQALNQAGGGATGKARGGLIYRDAGGFIPRGTDTIPAMLSPGEFVVNARSTQRFFSQLVSMNSGRQPVYRADGGTVTNVGDININMTGQPVNKDTARSTAQQLRRELRRKTSKL